LKPLIPVVLAGGVGSRLWPLSRALLPKPFHALFGERSLLQNTVLRAAKVAKRAPIVVCNEAHRFLAAEQLRALGLPWQCIALEPEGRNTAPAIALAAHLAIAEAAGAQLLVLPADHRIEDAEGFAAAVRTARKASEDSAVVTFGIVPSRAETGYGYIERAVAGQPGVQPVQRFVEKPNAKRARAFAASGRHLWNSGMFLVDAATALAEIEAHSPEMAAAVAESYGKGQADLDFFRPNDAFLRSPSASFDVTVMERTARAAVLPADFGWSDMGSWESVLEAAGADGRGNHFVGDVLPLDVDRTLVHSSHRLVGAIGIDHLVIVETADAVLVADRSRVQDVGALVAQLRASGRPQC